VDERIYFKEKTIVALSNELGKEKEAEKKLGAEISEMNSFISSIYENTVLLKKLDDLGYAEFEAKKSKLRIRKGDVMLVKDADIFSNKTLHEITDKVALIIAKKGGAKLPFTVISARKFEIKETELFGLVDRVKLEEEIAKLDILGKIVSEYKEERQA